MTTPQDIPSLCEKLWKMRPEARPPQVATLYENTGDLVGEVAGFLLAAECADPIWCAEWSPVKPEDLRYPACLALIRDACLRYLLSCRDDVTVGERADGSHKVGSRLVYSTAPTLTQALLLAAIQEAERGVEG